MLTVDVDGDCGRGLVVVDTEAQVGFEVRTASIHNHNGKLPQQHCQSPHVTAKNICGRTYV